MIVVKYGPIVVNVVGLSKQRSIGCLGSKTAYCSSPEMRLPYEEKTLLNLKNENIHVSFFFSGIKGK